ncbi:hypothetical protein HDV02_002705 [Globomyces sp. JEL0801]|nr:hypothetical protein HDV02_002705 [Globomyces sp. JEL0801]
MDKTTNPSDLEELSNGILHSIIQYLSIDQYQSFIRLSKRTSDLNFAIHHLHQLYQSKTLFKNSKWFKQYLDLKFFDYHEAFQFAVCHGYIDIVTLLLDYTNVDPSNDHNIALLEAIRNHDQDIIKILLNDSRVDPSTRDNEFLILACSNNQIETVGMLLNDKRVDPTSFDNQSLRRATRYGHQSVVSVLLNDPRVDPSSRDNEALISAARHNHSTIFRLLLNDERVNPSARNNQALRIAIQYGYQDILKLLLNDSRVEFIQDNELLVEAVNCDTNIVRMLLNDTKLDPSAAYNRLLRLAVEYGHKEIVDKLLNDVRVNPFVHKNKSIIAASSKNESEKVG